MGPTMGGLHGLNKGKRAERSVKDAFIECMEAVEASYPAIAAHSILVKRNTTQSDRGGADLVGIPGLAIEVKHHAKPALETWWKQCTRQARGKELPVLIWKTDHKPWRVRTWGALYVPGSVSHCLVIDCSLEGFLEFYAAFYAKILADELPF